MNKRSIKKVIDDKFDILDDKVYNVSQNISDDSIILYHGTTCKRAMEIQSKGFISDRHYNWKVTSSKGFVFLSRAYAPFYAMASEGDLSNLSLIKCSVSRKNLYPDDDFVMLVLDKPVYIQEDLDRINLENFKFLWEDSLNNLGNVAARPCDVDVLGIKCFNGRRLLFVCDPSISPINYQIMGDYYQKLTEWIFEGNSPEKFEHEMFKIPKEIMDKLKELV